MKTKTIILHYFFLIYSTSIVYSQTENISVTYKVYATEGSLEENEIIKKSKYSYLYDGLDNALTSLEFKLEANKLRSHFYLVDGLSINEKAKRMATNFTGRDEVFVDKKKMSCTIQKNILDKYYFVSNDFKNDWILINETKSIQGYLCYKATFEKKIRLKKDTFKNILVTAWYCPSIPFSFGPKDYYNLPGLILELQEDKITFLASKISLNEKNPQNLELDLNKNIITDYEFYKLLDQKTDEFFEKISKKNNDK